MPARTPRASAVRSAAASDASALETATLILEVVPAVMDAVRQAMRRQTGDRLTIPQFRALNLLARLPRSSVRELADFLGVTLPTASALVDRLTRAGWVDVQTDAADRRRNLLALTRSGWSLWQTIASDAHADLARTLSGVGQDHRLRVLAGLKVLRDLFPSVQPEPPQAVRPLPPPARRLARS